MAKLKKVLLKRSVSIFLIGAVFVSIVSATFIPQSARTAPAMLDAWRTEHGLLSAASDFLGLTHIYTTPWFALLIALATLSLALSSQDQFRIAWKNTFKRGEITEQPDLVTQASGLSLIATLRQQGFRLVAGDEQSLRFVRHPWGYWGNFLLHGGILVSVAASLLIALTYQQGSITLVEGMTHTPEQSLDGEEHGLLVGRLQLPAAIRLDRLRLAFSAQGHVQSAASDITLLKSDGTPEKSLTTAINAMLSHEGVTIYQSTDYGDAFLLDFETPGGERHREKIYIFHPEQLDKAGYSDFSFPWLGYRVLTKYYADAEMKSMASPHRLLILRFMDGEREVGRVSLKKGESGVLAGHLVNLVDDEKWSRLICVKITGIAAVFFGFFAVALGISLNYFTPPREVIAVGCPGGFMLQWRATKFAEFYDDELKSLEHKLAGEA